LIEIQKIIFKTKKELTEYIRHRISTYNIQEKLNFEDFRFFSELFRLHPRYTNKSGSSGIKHIYVDTNKYGNKGLFIIRNDHSTTDISWTECVTQTKKLQEIKLACRSSVSNQIITFITNYKKSHSVYRSAYSDKIISSDQLEVDHFNPTFDVLFNKWYEENKNILDFSINYADNVQGTFFSNIHTESSFSLYHFKYANLRIVSKEENRGILRKC
jgi:hypothetical protein